MSKAKNNFDFDLWQSIINCTGEEHKNFKPIDLVNISERTQLVVDRVPYDANFELGDRLSTWAVDTEGVVNVDVAFTTDTGMTLETCHATFIPPTSYGNGVGSPGVLDVTRHVLNCGHLENSTRRAMDDASGSRPFNYDFDRRATYQQTQIIDAVNEVFQDLASGNK